MDALGPQNPWDIWESERHFPAQLQNHKARSFRVVLVTSVEPCDLSGSFAYPRIRARQASLC